MIRQYAPRGVTMLVAAILVLVGIAGTFLGVLPAVAGYSGEVVGVAAFVVATIVMLLGIFTRGL